MFIYTEIQIYLMESMNVPAYRCPMCGTWFDFVNGKYQCPACLEKEQD
jgi:rubrerythrin